MKCRVTCEGFPDQMSVRLKKAVHKFFRCHPQTEVRFNVICTPDIEMQRMNRQFRKKNKTTDVLTFVYPALIEVYISLAVARQQARERKVTLAQECQRLLVHGICHAMGMDHYSRKDFIEMRRREFEVLVQCDLA